MSKTRYIVLQRGTNNSWFEFSPDVEATSAKSAIRTALKGEEDAGYYVAIPHRSFQPYDVEVETHRRVTIG